MQSEVGAGVCEYHIFDMGDYATKVPKELERVYYHQWGFMRQGGEEAPALARMMKKGEKNVFKGLKDTVRELGHDALDVIDIFVSCVFTCFKRAFMNVRVMVSHYLTLIYFYNLIEFTKKIDCEGCEWETYHDWMADDIPMLHQILVEVHNAPMDKVLDFFYSLDAAGYLRYHKEPNIQFDPACLEYGFVKVDKSFTKTINK